MTKKLTKKNKLLRMLPMLALAMVLALGCFTPAFADGPSDTPAQAAITKLLQFAQGTDMPTHVYKFDFAQGTKAEDGSASPAIPPVKIAFSPADPGVGGNADGIINLKKQATITWPSFTSTGTYSYHVTESTSLQDGTYVDVGETETLKMSKADYELVVRVADDNGTLYVKSVVAEIASEDAFTVKDDLAGTKVSATPGDGDHTFSAMQFTNFYAKVLQDPQPNDSSSEASLSFDVSVTGEMADTTQGFPLTIKLEEPYQGFVSEVGQGQTEFQAYVMDANGLVQNLITADDGNVGHGHGYLFTIDNARTIALSHGQRLIILDLPQGVRYSVTQAANEYYVPNVAVTFNGNAAVSTNNTTKNIAMSADQVASVPKAVSGGGSFASFTNAYAETPPTGVTANNLPFALMAMLGVAALAACAIARSRRRSAGVR